MVIGLTLLLMYFAYLEIIRRSLDIFNCRETDPSDGNEYAGFTSINCEGGYCICYEPGGVHMRLMYINIIPICVYVLGFPLFVHCVIKKNRHIIMEDQLLRAHDLGSVQAENKFAFWVRQRYSRMYYQFKPDKVHWIIVILWRKFMIVLIGGLLRNNASFQLAIMMLVLFTCYILHMKNRPYMSTVERLHVIEEHKAAVNDGVLTQVTIAAHIKQATDDRTTRMERKHKRGGRGGSSLNSAIQFAQRDGRDEKPESYFFNYNTMEAILLSCAILVCLCGVMFVSGELQRKGNEVPQVVATVFLTVVVMGSMVYIGVVFCSELGVKVPPLLLRLFADAKTALQKQNELKGLTIEDDDVELSANPLMRSQQNQILLDAAKDVAQKHQQMAAESAAAASAMSIQQDEMLLNMRNLKKNQAKNQTPARRRGKKNNKKKGSKGKKGFGPMALGDGDGEGIEMASVGSFLESKDGSPELSIDTKRKKKERQHTTASKSGWERNIVSTEDLGLDAVEVEMNASDMSLNPLHGGSSGGSLKKKGKSKKGRQNKKKKNQSFARESEGMDMFDTASGQNQRVNPLNRFQNSEETELSVADDRNTFSNIADTEDVYTDDESGKRYSIDRASGESKWLVEDDSNVSAF